MVSQKDFIVSSWRKKKFKNLFKNEIDIIIYKIEHKDYDVINLDKIFICTAFVGSSTAVRQTLISTWSFTTLCYRYCI